MRVFEAIAKSVSDHGIDTMFGLVGDANLYLADAYVRGGYGRYVAAANEAGATLMALGYASVSGKVGVATVTHGPALLNTLTALAEGVKGTMPMVLLCGDTPVTDRDHPQSVIQQSFVAATGAGFEQLRSAQTVSEDVARAFRRAAIERRPIVLNMPADLQWQEIEYQNLTFKLFENRGLVPSSIELDNAIGIIAAAKRPVIVAGRGVLYSDGAREALVRLANRTEALLATTLKARGFFSGEDYNLGLYGTLSTPVAVEAIMQSDCIIAFGASLNKYTLSLGAFQKGKRIIQVNLEQEEVGKSITPDAGLVGDAALTADAILHWLDEAEVQPSGFRHEGWKEALAAYVPEPRLFKETAEGTVDIRQALLRLDKAVPINRVFAADGGRFLLQTWSIFDVQDPRSFVFTSNCHAIGLGVSEAIGASAAAPDRPTLLVTGDGGFMLGGLAEFNTAVRCKCDLIVIICNDGSYGAEHIQFRNKGMDPSLTLFDWPEFADVANALGGKGVTVRNAADLEAAADAIGNRDRPLLIDIKLDPDRISEGSH